MHENLLCGLSAGLGMPALQSVHKQNKSMLSSTTMPQHFQMDR